MNQKKENGLVGVDMIVAIIAIMLFSTIIVSLMYNNVMENVKLKKETMAMIYITQIFENIGIESYDNITQENIDKFIPQEAKENYEVDINVTSDFEDITNNENIIKKITLNMLYEVGNKKYNCYMERTKIKE